MPLIPSQYNQGNTDQLKDMLDWLQNAEQFKNPISSIDLSNYPGMQPNNLAMLQSMMYPGGSVGGADAATSPFSTSSLYGKVGGASPDQLTAIYDLVQQMLKSRPAKK